MDSENQCTENGKVWMMMILKHFLLVVMMIIRGIIERGMNDDVKRFPPCCYDNSPREKSTRDE